MIVVERPGFGLSDFQKGRKLLDWPEDVSVFADALGIDRFPDISIPVYLWHGEEDANVSISAARYLAQAIPKCRATFLHGEGHWPFHEHWEEILRSVLSQGRGWAWSRALLRRFS